MPKVLSYTPAWLSRPSPGFQFFAIDREELAQDTTAKSQAPTAPIRRLAARGTETFSAVGNEIRWTNLQGLKDHWKAHSRKLSKAAEDEDLEIESYKTLYSNDIRDQIQQLEVSPNGSFIAILTATAAFVAVLPDPSLLEAGDSSRIRLVNFTLGGSVRRLQTETARALWHPLGVAGSCLTTISIDAVVKLWELNIEDRSSFENPTLTLDLAKLANPNPEDDDPYGSPASRNRGFSPDDVEMEVAAACWGGQGTPKEDPWAAMTLWVCMKEGDIYALCPLLPTRWQTHTEAVPGLQLSITADAALSSEDNDSEKRAVTRRQHRWISNLNGQDPLVFQPPLSRHALEIYTTPKSPSPVPSLQGPFSISSLSESDDPISLLSDIFVIAADNSERAELLVDDLSDADETSELSVTTICTCTASGKVHICVNLDTVKGVWASRTSDYDPDNALIRFETIDLMTKEERTNVGLPVMSTITADPLSLRSFFVNHAAGVTHISLEQWAEMLESELCNDDETGLDTRIKVLSDGEAAQGRRLCKLYSGDSSQADDSLSQFSASIVFADHNLGYMLLTSAPDQPFAVLLDWPKPVFTVSAEAEDVSAPLAIEDGSAVRQSYQPPSSLYGEIGATSFATSILPQRHQKHYRDEIRLSPAALEVMVKAHQAISRDAGRIKQGVADLFNRCEKMKLEYAEQIERVRGIDSSIESFVQGDSDAVSANGAVETRIKDATEKHAKLEERFQKLLRRLQANRGRELSAKEEAWISEVESLERSIVQSEDSEAEAGVRSRFESAKSLSEELNARAREISKHAGISTNSPTKIPAEIRKGKVNQITGLLERQSALIEATSTRLDRLRLVQ